MRILAAIGAACLLSYVVTFCAGMVYGARILRRSQPKKQEPILTVKTERFSPTLEDEEAAFLAGECGHTLVRVPGSDYAVAHGRPEQGRC